MTTSASPEFGEVTMDEHHVLGREGAYRFPTNATRDEDFHLGSGDVVQVPTMQLHRKTLLVGSVGDLTCVELPYENQAVSMLLLVPAAGALEELERTLDGQLFDRCEKALRPFSFVLFTLPRFTVKPRSSLRLRAALSRLGMPEAFAPSADFSGIGFSIRVDDVYHQAAVRADEHGTVAAAGSAVVGVPSLSFDARLRVDRPFLFAISEKSSGALLFLGKVADPRAL